MTGFVEDEKASKAEDWKDYRCISKQLWSVNTQVKSKNYVTKKHERQI